MSTLDWCLWAIVQITIRVANLEVDERSILRVRLQELLEKV